MSRPRETLPRESYCVCLHLTRERAPSSREYRTGHAEHAGLLLLLVLQLDGVLLLLLVQRLQLPAQPLAVLEQLRTGR